MNKILMNSGEIYKHKTYLMGNYWAHLGYEKPVTKSYLKGTLFWSKTVYYESTDFITERIVKIKDIKCIERQDNG